MRKFLRIILRVLFVVIILIAGLLAYVKWALPNAGEVTNIQVKSTPELIKRGEYLANNVAVCMDCHSTRDWTQFSGPIKPGTLGKGGDYFGTNAGLPGDFYARNITPYGIKDWTDAELYHLITTGINKHGEAMFPIMPYKSYAQMDPEDVKAIIAYLHSLQPIKSTIPKRSIKFPMNFIINTIPSAATPSKRPNPSNRLAYGKYLTSIAACADCHTPQHKGAKIEGMDFAGGFEFLLPSGTVRSANITPDETGIGHWTKEGFIDRFAAYRDTANIAKNLKMDQYNTIMPWIMYAGMSDDDLGAIYDYIKTVKPVKNKVNVFTKKK